MYNKTIKMQVESKKEYKYHYKKEVMFKGKCDVIILKDVLNKLLQFTTVNNKFLSAISFRLQISFN